MALIDLELCNSTRWYNGRIRSTNVCAGYPRGKIDTCQVTSFWVPRPLQTPLFFASLSKVPWSLFCIHRHDELGRRYPPAAPTQNPSPYLELYSPEHRDHLSQTLP